MELDAEARRQLVVAVGTVGSFVALIVAIGIYFPEEAFEQTGALALIGAMVVFVLVMALVGFYLSRKTE